ncbi:hypothetical protein VPH35_056201 [Triticum aestivum]
MTTDCTGGFYRPIDNREEEAKSMNLEKKTAKKKKKIFRLPQDELDYCLTFQVRPIRQSLALWDPSTAAKVEKINKRILVEQENMRQEYEAKGYVTFEAEVTDDDEEEVEDAAAGAAAPCIIPQVGVEDAAALCITAQVGGRRRFRPGIVKQACRVKKIII